MSESASLPFIHSQSIWYLHKLSKQKACWVSEINTNLVCILFHIVDYSWYLWLLDDFVFSSPWPEAIVPVTLHRLFCPKLWQVLFQIRRRFSLRDSPKCSIKALRGIEEEKGGWHLNFCLQKIQMTIVIPFCEMYTTLLHILVKMVVGLRLTVICDIHISTILIYYASSF